MKLGNRSKISLLLIGDIIALYAALFITLGIRYGGAYYEQFEDVHALPFTIIFIFWIIIFYISGLYDLRRLRNNLDFLKTLSLSLVVDAVFAVLMFYLIPTFGIAPKTNLFIVIIIFAVIEIFWRRFFNRMTASGDAPNRVLLVGNGAISNEAEQTVFENTQLGYKIVRHLRENEIANVPESLEAIVRDDGINMVVIPRELKHQDSFAPVLYKLFGKGITIIDLDSFYELIMQKIPLADVKETWFLENIEGASKFYDQFKRAIEFLFALVIGIILLPIEILIAIIIKLTSRGPLIYKQVRVGQNGENFTLYKFRSMRIDAEKAGAKWAEKNDARITLFGRFLRKTHLDELPQLWNLVRGDVSFVGPRPERPEFVEKLEKQIPYYEVRLLIKPGVTGWAQLNHRADLDLEDVKQKLQYDIYYLKNRSPILDIAIILKTAKSLFVNPK